MFNKKSKIDTFDEIRINLIKIKNSIIKMCSINFFLCFLHRKKFIEHIFMLLCLSFESRDQNLLIIFHCNSTENLTWIQMQSTIK